MQVTILLTKEDIVTSKCGLHFQITTGLFTLNLTPDAVEELINDLSTLKDGGRVNHDNPEHPEDSLLRAPIA